MPHDESDRLPESRRGVAGVIRDSAGQRTAGTNNGAQNERKGRIDMGGMVRRGGQCPASKKGPGDLHPSPWKVLAPGAGFEPATNRLTVDCSTAELSGISGRRIPTPLRLRNPFRTGSNGNALPTIILRGGGCSGRRHVVIGGPSGRRCGALPWKASWRSGYAEDCKSLHPGSIPGEASKFPDQK